MAAKTAAKAVPSKAVAKVESQATVVSTVDDETLADLLDDAGAGLENATASDYALAFVHLLQKMSPQVDKADPKYIEGAEPGMFINSVTQELFEELKVIPVDFSKVYIEWIPRDQGGGFVASYGTKADAEANCEAGHQIVDTANHFILLWSNQDETWTPAILSLTSTKLKASRNWVSKMSMVTIAAGGNRRVVAPTYAKYYKVMPDGPMKNEHGTFYVIKVDAVEGEDGWVKDAELRNQAKNFRASLKAGTKGADFSKAEVVEAEEEEEPGTPKY